MNQIPISPNIWKLAQAILTQNQYDVLQLREQRGCSWHQIAIYMNRTKATVRGHHEAATKNLLDAIEAAGGIEEAYARALDAAAIEQHEKTLRMVRPT